MRDWMLVVVTVALMLFAISFGEAADISSTKPTHVVTKGQEWLDRALQTLCAAEEGRRMFNNETGECESIPPEELLQELWQFYSKKGDGT